MPGSDPRLGTDTGTVGAQTAFGSAPRGHDGRAIYVRLVRVVRPGFDPGRGPPVLLSPVSTGRLAGDGRETVSGTRLIELIRIRSARGSTPDSERLRSDTGGRYSPAAVFYIVVIDISMEYSNDPACSTRSVTRFRSSRRRGPRRSLRSQGGRHRSSRGVRSRRVRRYVSPRIVDRRFSPRRRKRNPVRPRNRDGPSRSVAPPHEGSFARTDPYPDESYGRYRTATQRPVGHGRIACVGSSMDHFHPARGTFYTIGHQQRYVSH